MKIVTIIARILLGLDFAFFGVFTFFQKAYVPMPGVAGELNAALFHSHWNLSVAIAQIIAGVLLLINRYVTVALIILAAFLYNSFTYHILAFPAGLPLAAIAFILWFIVAWPYRSDFAALFNARK